MQRKTTSQAEKLGLRDIDIGEGLQVHEVIPNGLLDKTSLISPDDKYLEVKINDGEKHIFIDNFVNPFGHHLEENWVQKKTKYHFWSNQFLPKEDWK